MYIVTGYNTAFGEYLNGTLYADQIEVIVYG